MLPCRRNPLRGFQPIMEAFNSLNLLQPAVEQLNLLVGMGSSAKAPESSRAADRPSRFPDTESENSGAKLSRHRANRDGFMDNFRVFPASGFTCWAGAPHMMQGLSTG